MRRRRQYITQCSYLKISKKRHLILLEVLIAFALVALCVLPLIYPQVFILKSEREFINTIDLDHTVNLLYANRLQKMYQNEIGLSEIEGGKPVSITEAHLQEIGYTKEFPYKGEYQFTILKRKPPPPEDRLYLVKLVFSFTQKKTFQAKNKELGDKKPKELTYEYEIFVERRPKQVKDGEVKEEQVKEEEVKEEKVKEAKP